MLLAWVALAQGRAQAGEGGRYASICGGEKQMHHETITGMQEMKIKQLCEKCAENKKFSVGSLIGFSRCDGCFRFKTVYGCTIEKPANNGMERDQEHAGDVGK